MFNPISVSTFSIADQDRWYRPRSSFGDTRLKRQYEKLINQMLNKQSLVINQLSSTRRESEGYYRFMRNKKVDVREIVSDICCLDNELGQTDHLLILGDTTSFNLSTHIKRIQDSDRIGNLTDRSPGFLAHVNLGLDAETGHIVGLTDILLWTRLKEKEKEKRSNWSERESYKWAAGLENSVEALPMGQKQTYVFDQEADMKNLYSKFYHYQSAYPINFVIRNRHDYNVTCQSQACKLSEALASSSILGIYQLEIPSLNHYSYTKGGQVVRTGRISEMEVRLAKIEMVLPDKEKMSLWAIKIEEVNTSLPEGESPICWTLLTSHPITNFEQARQIIQYYLWRWIIEQLFRTMKSKGFNVEATELETYDGILKQTVMGFKSATKVLQLVYARNQNQENAQNLNQVFNDKEQKVLKILNKNLEGKTEKQQNPCNQTKLSWATWVIARMGGWKGYQSQRPPGPITIKNGLDKFHTYLEALEIFDP